MNGRAGRLDPLGVDLIAYVRSPTVLWRRTALTVVLLPAGAGAPTRLEGTGVQLWAMLHEPRTLDQIAAQLSAEFGTDPHRIATDLEPVLDQLVEIGAVERNTSRTVERP